MQFKYIVLIAWFVGLILYVGGWFLKDNKEKGKMLWTMICLLGAAITCAVIFFLVYGVIAPEITGSVR